MRACVGLASPSLGIEVGRLKLERMYQVSGGRWRAPERQRRVKSGRCRWEIKDQILIISYQIR